MPKSSTDILNEMLTTAKSICPELTWAPESPE